MPQNWSATWVEFVRTGVLGWMCTRRLAKCTPIDNPLSAQRPDRIVTTDVCRTQLAGYHDATRPLCIYGDLWN